LRRLRGRGAIDRDGGIDEKTNKRRFVDVRSQEGATAESVGFVGCVKGARLPAGNDPC
jgi:hypothetical protein